LPAHADRLGCALPAAHHRHRAAQKAYKVTLVSCIVPLAAGIFWKPANVPGAVLSVVFGLLSWTTHVKH